MASALPNELIVKIAEYLIEPNQYVIFQRKQHLEEHHLSVPNEDFTIQLRPQLPLSKPQTSPLTLALFSPVLLAEYVKLLHKRAVFYFYHGGYLYNYIKPPEPIRESVLETRRSIRFIRFVSWAMCKEETRKRRHREGFDPTSPDAVLGRAISLLPKVETVHVDFLPCPFRDAFSRGNWQYSHHVLIRHLRPLIERTENVQSVLTLGRGNFGQLTTLCGRLLDDDVRASFTECFLETIEMLWPRRKAASHRPPTIS